MLFTRTTPDTEPESDHVWSVGEVIAEKLEDAADQQSEIAPGVRKQVVTVHCALCPVSMPHDEWQRDGHRCQFPTLTPRQQHRAERSRRANAAQLAAVQPRPTVCDLCERDVPAGTAHACSGKPKVPGLKTAEEYAAEFQAQSLIQTLREMGYKIEKADGSPG